MALFYAMYVDLLQLEEELDRFLYDFGFFVVDLKTAGMRGPGRTFRLFIERVDQQPVSIADCGAVARQVVLFLELKGVYNNDCSLEVSSGGVDRVLKRERDFERYLGSLIKVRYFNGSQPESVTGALRSFTDEVLVLELEPIQLAQERKGGALPLEPPKVLQVLRASLERVNLVPVLEL
jgi:ribosome maturation factor RimP